MSRAAPQSNVRALYADVRDVPDAALVQAARDDQAWAQEALFKRYAHIAIAKACRLMPAHDPEDLAQDALVHALLHLKSLKADHAFGAWLNCIIVRLGLSRLRRAYLWQRVRHFQPDDVDADAMTTGLAGEARVQAREVYEMLHELHPEERVALLLRRVEGLELGEVAREMGLSLATVKRRIAAAERKLAAAKWETP